MFLAIQVFQLEKDLEEALKAAGRPPVIPRRTAPEPEIVIPQVTQPVVKSRPPVKSLSAENISDASGGESDVSSPELSPGKCCLSYLFDPNHNFVCSGKSRMTAHKLL